MANAQGPGAARGAFLRTAFLGKVFPRGAFFRGAFFRSAFFRSAFLLTSAALVLAGCDAAPGSGDGTVFRDSAGIRIVENDHRRPAWGDDGLRLSEVPVLQVGSVDAEGPEQLFSVMHAELLPHGELLVLNSGSTEVRIFDAEGRHVRSFGRRGDGPGEFTSPWFAYPHSGDSLLVLDLYRYASVFDLEGRYVRRFVPGDVVGESQGAPHGRFADGSLLLERRGADARPAYDELTRLPVEAVRVDLEGRVTGSFGPFDQQTVGPGGGLSYMLGPWGRVRAGLETFWYGPGDRFELQEWDLSGALVRLVRLDLPPRPVTQAHVDAYVDARVAGMEGMPEQVIRMFTENFYVPEHFPAHGLLRVDDSGRVWVQEFRPLGDEPAPTWYVFDAEGRYLGRVETPERFVVFRITGDRMVGRWTDELDVEYVRVYALEGGTGG